MGLLKKYMHRGGRGGESSPPVKEIAKTPRRGNVPQNKGNAKTPRRGRRAPWPNIPAKVVPRRARYGCKPTALKAWYALHQRFTICSRRAYPLVLGGECCIVLKIYEHF
jgi:hypothetical protein